VGLWLAFSAVPGEWTWPKWSSMKQMLEFSVPLGLASTLGMITLQLDKVIVSAMTSPEEFAVYANGAVEIPLIGIITGSVTAVVLADMRKHAAKGEYRDAIRLFRLTAEKTSYILFPVMFFLFLSADSFIQTLFSEKYIQSVIPFRWYLLLLPVRTVVFGSLLMAIDKTKVILVRSLISLIINGVLSVIFVISFGPWGAVVATVLTVYLWDVLYNLYTLGVFFKISWDKFFPLKIWGKTIAFLMIPSLFLFIFNKNVYNFSPVFRLIAGGTVYWISIFLWWNGKIYSMNKLIKATQNYFRRYE
jgi:O-antigen/teichoic acid export membrane protein